MEASVPFRHPHRVTYSECTVGNHIYHSRYLDLFEAARGEFLRAAGYPVQQLQEAGYIFPVVELTVQYLRPARYDDVLSIEIALVELSALRLGVRHRVWRGEEVLVEGVTRHVCTSLEEKPRRMPKPLLEVLQGWLRPEPPAPQAG